MKQGIILAAGLGTRLKEITKITPKSLIQVDSQPILERNINFMFEAGLERVILVVGYMHEKFEYLKEKYENYNLKILYNEKYETSNTVTSLYLARNYLKNESFITTADIYLHSNPYIKYCAPYSYYLLRPAAHFLKPDWIAQVDEEFRFVSVDQHAFDGYSYTGISHWMSEGGEFIRNLLEEIDWNEPNACKMYWDELVLPHLGEFKLYAKILENNCEVYEFDDIFDIGLLKNEMGLDISY